MCNYNMKKLENIEIWNKEQHAQDECTWVQLTKLYKKMKEQEDRNNQVNEEINAEQMNTSG